MIPPLRLGAILGPLKDFVDYPDGIFRVYYTMRDVAEGRTAGLMGVVNRDLVLRYVHALELTARRFLDWGWERPHPWPQHGHRVPAFVFDTSRWVRAQAAYTQTDLWGYSQVGLRSLLPEPRHDVMWERAEIEAVHEAAHVFTHRHRRPQPRVWGGDIRNDLWYWLDEATAVFMEGQIFRGHKEPMRFAINFVYQPEQSLVDEGPGGGYSAAWFVRHLVETYGHEILRDAWKQAERIDADPVEIIDRDLRQRGSSFDATFTDYCAASASMCRFDFDVFIRHGNRLASESFRLDSVGSARRSSVVDQLDPLACRYYRIEWADAGIRSIQAMVKPEAAPTSEGLSAMLIPFCGDGFARPRLDLAPSPGASGLWGVMPMSGGATHAILVVARGTSPADRGAGFRVECSAS